MSTQEAILSGIVYGLAAAVADFVLAWKKENPDSIITMTGGDAKMLQKVLVAIHGFIIPDEQDEEMALIDESNQGKPLASPATEKGARGVCPETTPGSAQPQKEEGGKDGNNGTPFVIMASHLGHYGIAYVRDKQFREAENATITAAR